MGGIERKTPVELAKMRQAGRMVAAALQLLSDIAEPGLTTEQLDRAAGDYILKSGGTPAFKGYRGFPANICASINEEIVHGIPGPRKLREGDLLKLDIGVIWDGYYGDGAVTVPIGEVSEEARALMLLTREALNVGISAVRAGVRINEIAGRVQETAEARGYSVVRDYSGHGIGRALHEDPRVPNYVERRVLSRDPVLPEGAVIALEPMVNAGRPQTELLSNGWTVVTRDRKLSAHFEHTVAVGADGPVILTLP
jgi:methionyl aminopeptidase